MKILLYNIAYGTGSPGGEYRRLLTSHHYLAAPERPFRKIANFIAAQRPDAACLIEADLGSRRTGNENQVEHLAERLGYCCFYHQKYAPNSPLLKLPYMRFQGNAILSRDPDCALAIDFFPRGTKKLILFSKLGAVTLVLVHLALTKRIRKIQLDYLADILPAGVPLIVAGDFNTFSGSSELTDFLDRTKLRSANEKHSATYPAWKPAKELDYLLLSPELQLNGIHLPKVRFSDHLPLIADIDLIGSE